MTATRLGYAVVNNTTTNIKPTPAGFFGLSVTGAGNVSVYDGLSASGTLIYSKSSATVGTTVDFGGKGIACNTGLTVVTTGTVAVLYT